MRGIKECLNWLMDNPMKELSTGINPSINRRRYNGSNESFETFNSRTGEWFILSSFYTYNDYEYDWQPYDPNPEVEFHVAYMDCLENNVSYRNVAGDRIDKLFNCVQINLIEPKFTGTIIPNGCKWKKVL